MAINKEFTIPDKGVTGDYWITGPIQHYPDADYSRVEMQLYINKAHRDTANSIPQATVVKNFVGEDNPMSMKNLGSVCTKEYTTDYATEATHIVCINHGLKDEQVIRLDASVALNTGLTPATDYNVIVVDADTIEVETSIGNGAESFTSDGSGTLSIVCSKNERSVAYEKIMSSSELGTFVYNGVDIDLSTGTEV